jgi:acyl-coenzyme A thioesterase 13
MTSGMTLEQLQQALSARDERGGWHMHGLEAVALDGRSGRVAVRVEVDTHLVNMAQTLHGGAAATLIDVVGTLAIIVADRHHRPGVSTDLNVSWFNPAPLGEVVLIEATVLKIGKTMAFVSVDLTRESDGILLVQGRMTKALGVPPEG